MTALAIPNSGLNSFTVISATAISYNGQVYEGVTDIQFADGTHKTCAQIITDAGGDSFTPSELKVCVKVQAIDPDSAGKQIFLAYSSNSSQTAKNSVAQVPGGVTVDVFDFTGTVASNYILKMWADANAPVGAYSPTWLGFKINYGTMERRSYVMTQLNDFNEESIPSPPTNVDTTLMHDVLLRGAFRAPAPLGADLYVPMRTFKLYRAAITSNFNFVFQRVPVLPKTIKLGLNFALFDYAPSNYVMPRVYYAALPGIYNIDEGYAFTDNVLTQNLLEALPSMDWDAPPPRALKGLIAWRNGMMAAYSDNQLYLCEPFRPFTFPQKYIKALPRKILGLSVDENALIAVTEAEPYMVIGAHPSNVTYERLQGVQAAIAPIASFGGINPTRALVRTPHGIFYATREGMIRIQNGRAEKVWGELFTREEWTQRYMTFAGAMRLAYFDGNILCYFDGVPGANGFIVNIDGETPRLVEYQGASQVADFVLPLRDSMYVVTYNGTQSSILRFADESVNRLQGTYQTRDVIEADPCNFGCMQLVGTGNVIATVFADGAQVAIIAFTLPAIFTGQQTVRLPAGFKARRWSVRFALDVNAVVSEAYLAETRLELKKVP